MKHHFKMSEFKKQGEDFFNSLAMEMNRMDLPIGHLKVDHLCFRVQTQEEYKFYKGQLEECSQMLTEEQVNGRAIATFRLFEGFNTLSGLISLLELPSPKPGVDYKTGFEHAEFLIRESLQTFQKRFPAIQFRISGNKNLNPELCLETSAGRAKFHYTPLNRIIDIENANITDIIFDFDGTLIQSRQQIYQINSLIFSEICQREVTQLEAKEKFHAEFSKLFHAFEVSCPKKMEKAIEDWGKVSQKFEFPLFHGVTELLQSLKGTTRRLHLWTARDKASALKILRTHGIADFFTTLNFANCSRSKPHPESLSFEWAKTAPHSLLMVGDSPTDIIGGKNINAISAAAMWDEESNLDNLVFHGAELFFYETEELLAWLGDL